MHFLNGCVTKKIVIVIVLLHSLFLDKLQIKTRVCYFKTFSDGIGITRKIQKFFKKFIKVLGNPEIFQEKCFGGVNVYSSWKPVTLLQMSFIKCVFPRISKRKNIVDFIF